MRACSIALALIFSFGGTAMADPIVPDVFAKLDNARRKEAIARLSREEQAALFKGMTSEQLVQIGEESLRGMPSYQAELVKQERVKGKILPAQTMMLEVREQPFAVRLQVIDGPAKGRKVLYNSTLKPHEIRAKEAGLLGFAGALWVDKDGSLAKGDTNHPITDLGFANLLRIIGGDLKAAAPAGGMQREDLGFDGDGLYCLRTTPPKGVKSYAAHSKLCFDPNLGLPVKVEVEDVHGFLERFAFKNVKPRTFTDADFQPEAFGL